MPREQTRERTRSRALSRATSAQSASSMGLGDRTGPRNRKELKMRKRDIMLRGVKRFIRKVQAAAGDAEAMEVEASRKRMGVSGKFDGPLQLELGKDNNKAGGATNSTTKHNVVDHVLEGIAVRNEAAARQSRRRLYSDADQQQAQVARDEYLMYRDLYLQYTENEIATAQSYFESLTGSVTDSALARRRRGREARITRNRSAGQAGEPGQRKSATAEQPKRNSYQNVAMHMAAD